MNDCTVIRFAQFFANTIHTCTNLHGFHNDVFLINGAFILRIAAFDHRDKSQTEAEIAFLLYLKAHSACVCGPLPGLSGDYLYQATHKNKSYIITAFEVAKGKDFRSRGTDGQYRYFQIGKALGRIHSLSKVYFPSGAKRRLWTENQHLINAESVFKSYDLKLLKRYREYLSALACLSRDRNAFGLIHGDYLFSNYNFDNDNIIIFDFDESEYSWYLYDIAVCLYYSLLGSNPKILSEKAKEAENEFGWIMQGYIEENSISIEQIKNIDLFFKMRDFVLLSTILEKQQTVIEGWQRGFIDGALDRVLNKKAFMDIDYEGIFKRLSH